MINRKIVTSLVITGPLVAVGIFSGKILAFDQTFNSPKITMGEDTYEISPVVEIEPVGTKFGLRFFRMRDEFFVRVSYLCTDAKGRDVEIYKDGVLATPSEVFRSSQKCHTTFRSESRMGGNFTMRVTRGPDKYEKSIVLRRITGLSCPWWNMLMSA